MAIDVGTPRSPGWWLHRLTRKLAARQDRLELLDSWQRGDPPLPPEHRNARAAYQAFQSEARTTYARLIVEAVRYRMLPSAPATGDPGVDRVLRDQWTRNEMVVEAAEVHRSMLGMGDGYVIAGLDGDGAPAFTAEDPRQVVTAHDPLLQRRTVAALKLFVDDVGGEALAYLYLPDGLRVATSPGRPFGVAAPRFDPRSWRWDPDRSFDYQRLLGGRVPVIRFRNERGVAEFEPHLGHLGRINRMLLHRMWITTVQAFRQRAIRGLPTHYPAGNPKAGQEIDYEGRFEADPGALWLLPAAVEFWESGQVDLTPILVSVRDDVRDLAAVTFTPLYYFAPDAASQSASGAAMMRESLVFKAEDRIARARNAWERVAALGLMLAGTPFDPAALHVPFSSAERYSLAERYDAAVKAGPAGVPWRGVMADVLQLPPETVDRYETERDPNGLPAGGETGE